MSICAVVVGGNEKQCVITIGMATLHATVFTWVNLPVIIYHSGHSM